MRNTTNNKWDLGKTTIYDNKSYTVVYRVEKKILVFRVTSSALFDHSVFRVGMNCQKDK